MQDLSESGLTITGLRGDFAAEISGVDLNEPLGQALFEDIQAALDSHCVAVFRDQFLDDEALVAFADLRACYDDWAGPFGDIDKDALEDLTCEHSIIYSRSLISGDIFTDEEKKAFAPPHHPLVRRHPRTGRKVYYVSSHCSHVVGWPLDRGRALIRELTGFCIRPEHVYSHAWRAGDVVVWDNRSVLHRGRTYDPAERRVMHRATVAGTAV